MSRRHAWHTLALGRYLIHRGHDVDVVVLFWCDFFIFFFFLSLFSFIFSFGGIENSCQGELLPTPRGRYYLSYETRAHCCRCTSRRWSACKIRALSVARRSSATIAEEHDHGDDYTAVADCCPLCCCCRRCCRCCCCCCSGPFTPAFFFFFFTRFPSAHIPCTRCVTLRDDNNYLRFLYGVIGTRVCNYSKRKTKIKN